jgi:hypothetical protein
LSPDKSGDGSFLRNSIGCGPFSRAARLFKMPTAARTGRNLDV